MEKAATAKDVSVHITRGVLKNSLHICFAEKCVLLSNTKISVVAAMN